MRLVGEQGELAGQAFSLERPVVVLGRGKESDIVLLESDVSRQHARLQRGPQGWTLVDLGTTNGTFVNGKRLPAQEPYLLRPGDRIAIGSSVFAVQEEGAPGGTPARTAGPVTSLHPAILLGAALLFVLVLVGAVALLVAVLEPKDVIATPTAINQEEQLLTVIPLPTEMQDIVSTIAPILPDLFGVTPTAPPPGAALPAPAAVDPDSGS